MRHDQTVKFRCTESDREALERLAERRGTSMSEEARRAIRVEARTHGITTTKETSDYESDQS